MTIQRRPDVPFAQIANAMLRDKRLSFKARGILAMVLSHAEEWDAQRDWIENQSDHDGRAAVQSALNELTKFGYRRVGKEQQADGTFRTVVLWFHEPEENDLSIIRPTENPTDGKPDRRRSGPSTEDNLSEDNQQKTITKETPAADAAFIEFWTIYPRRAQKAKARKAFTDALKKVPRETILTGAARYRDDPNRKPEYTAHPASWLNAERWDDDPEPTPAPPLTAAQARAAAGKRELDAWVAQHKGGTL